MTLTTMVEICDIDISQKEIITKLYRKYGNLDCAHSFESLFMWKDDLDLELFIAPDLYTVKDRFDSENSWFFPVGSKQAKIDFISELLRVPELTFTYMTKEDKNFLEDNFPGIFDITEAPDDSEYLYTRETMEELPGSVFSKSRGYIRKLLATYDIKTVPLNEVSLDDMLKVAQIWNSNKQELATVIDGSATVNALSNKDELGLSGVVLILEGIPCAVCAGFQLNEETVDCCVQKSTQGMQGLNFYLRQEFAKSQPSSVKYFNWEEDMGLEGLRHAKSLMRPTGMLEMFRGEKL